MIKRLKNKLFSGESGGVYRGMLTLLIGSGLARIVGLASIPILTRLYSPEDYGVLAVYTSLVAILAPILTFRYVTAIPLPKTDTMAFNLFVLCVQLIVFGTLILATLLAVFGNNILSWLSMEELAPYRWLILVGVMGTATFELFNMWATRKRSYKLIARTHFEQSLLGNFVKIGLGLISIKPLGLVVGQILAQSAGIGSYLRSSRKEFRKNLPRFKIKNQKLLVRYYQDFPKYRLPSQFLMVLSVQAPVMLMAALYGKLETGQLGLAIMALSLPVSLIGGAISKAYYAEIAAIGKADVPKIRRITINTQVKLLVLSIPIALTFMVVSRPLFTLVFGEEWGVAGSYAAILSPYVLLQFTSSPLVHVINIIGSQSFFLAINIIRVTGLVIIYLILTQYSVSSEIFVVIISTYLFLFYLGVSAFIFRVVSIKDDKKY